MTLEHRPPVPDDQTEALAFLKSGRRLRGLSPAQYRRIGQRLATPVSPRKRRLLMPVMAACGLVLIAGTALARVVDFSRLPLIGPLFPAPVVQPTHKTGHSSSQRALSGNRLSGQPAEGIVTAPPGTGPTEPSLLESAKAAPSGANVVSPEPPAGTLPPRHRRASVREAALPPALETAAPEGAMPRPSAALAPPVLHEDPVLAESRSFSEAAARWHRDHNAKSALAALDAHERDFPRGQMQTEARLLRAEIFLQQGREPESLALLDKLLLSELPRGRELLTVRGELRVKYGRCPEAKRDLDRVLSTNTRDALARRATRALGLCP